MPVELLIFYAEKMKINSMSLKQKLHLIFLSLFVVNFIACHSTVSLNQDGLSIIVNKVDKILKLCFSNRFKSLIITKDLVDYIDDEFIDKSASVSILFIDDLLKLIMLSSLNPGMATFVLSIQSREQLNITLSTIRASSWWNTRSIFFIIEPLDNLCANASKTLKTAWENSILSVTYFCYHSDKNEVMLYTFNPFTNRAPLPWKLVEDVDTHDVHWTLYEQFYSKDEKLCSSLTYDKSIQLDGYGIKSLAFAEKGNDLDKPIDLQTFKSITNSDNFYLLATIFSIMNATLLIFKKHLLWVSINNMDAKLKAELEKNNYCLYLHAVPHIVPYKHITSTAYFGQMVMLTQKRPFLSTEEKILSFYNSNIVTPIVIVVIISSLVLQVNQRQEFKLALLKIWRLILGVGITQPLNNNPTRIYFFGVLWLVIILNATFQGNLALLLTKPERHYVNSIGDALKLNYKIYGTDEFMGEFKSPQLSSNYRSRFIIIHGLHCSLYVLNDSQAACMMLGPHASVLAEKKELYISPPVQNFYFVYWMSTNFSLTNRINDIILRIHLSGLTEYWNRKSYIDKKKKLLSLEAEATKARFRPMKLDDFAFAFKVLLINLVCAFIVFLFELRNRH